MINVKVYIKSIVYKVAACLILALRIRPKKSIVALHNIKDVSVLRKLLVSLSEHYCFVTLDQIMDLNFNTELPQLCLTFDDGYKEWYTEVLPLVENLKIPAVFFVSSGAITNANDDESKWYIKKNLQRHDTTLELMESFMLQKLSMSSYATIGGHTQSHYDLGSTEDQNLISNEILNDKITIEAIINKSISCFAYPYGRKNNINDTTLNVLKDSAYRYALTIIPGEISYKTNNYLIPRCSLDPELGYSYWNSRIISSKFF